MQSGALMDGRCCCCFLGGIWLRVERQVSGFKAIGMHQTEYTETVEQNEEC